MRGALPVAVTRKVALSPGPVATLVGWAVMVGGAETASTALELVAEPDALVATTE